MTEFWCLSPVCCRKPLMLWSNAMKRYFVLFITLILLTAGLTGCSQKEITDGVYTVEVTLTGGSGKATVESPAKVVITEGKAVATIIWSSPFYEYMLVGETRYEPIQEEGNATFEIPVVLDEDMAVSASTVAMSQPHLVEYTLHFNSKTLKGE